MALDEQPLAQWLTSHAWVSDARCVHAEASVGVLLALSDKGIDALRCLGRQSWTNRLQADAASAGHMAASWTWRLFDTLPGVMAPEDMLALLHAPLPREATLLHEERHDDLCTLALRIPPDLVYFSGHFPQAPIVPGVAQIAWALAFAAPRFGTTLRCHAMEVLKFQQLLRPGDQVTLSLRLDAVTRKLHFTYRQGEKSYSSGRLVWSAA